MTLYSGDEDCGDEITSPDCELLDDAPLPPGACPDCDGTGRVAVHTCDPYKPCRCRGLVVQACAACLATGRVTR